MPSTTFTYTAQDGQRIALAAGHALGLKDENGTVAASAAETKALLVAHIKQFVKHHEKLMQQEALSNITDIDVT